MSAPIQTVNGLVRTLAMNALGQKHSANDDACPLCITAESLIRDYVAREVEREREECAAHVDALASRIYMVEVRQGYRFAAAAIRARGGAR